MRAITDSSAKRLPKHRDNLCIIGDKVYSYRTHVATIDGGKLIEHGKWSQTTSRHVSYVASFYGLTIEREYAYSK